MNQQCSVFSCATRVAPTVTRAIKWGEPLSPPDPQPHAHGEQQPFVPKIGEQPEIFFFESAHRIKNTDRGTNSCHATDRRIRP